MENEMMNLVTYEQLEDLIDSGKASLHKTINQFNQTNISIFTNNVSNNNPTITNIFTIKENSASIINQAFLVFEFQMSASAACRSVTMIPNAIYNMFRTISIRTNSFEFTYTPAQIARSFGLFVNANTAANSGCQDYELFGTLYNENWIPISNDSIPDISYTAGAVTAPNYNTRWNTNNQLGTWEFPTNASVAVADVGFYAIKQNRNKEFINGLTFNNGREFELKTGQTIKFYYKMFLSKALLPLSSLNLLSGTINMNFTLTPSFNSFFKVNDPTNPTITLNITKMGLEHDVVEFHQKIDPFNYRTLTSIGMKELPIVNQNYTFRFTYDGTNWNTTDNYKQIAFNSPLTSGQNLKMYLFPYIENITFTGTTNQAAYNNAMIQWKTASDNSITSYYNGCCLNDLFRNNNSYLQYNAKMRPFSTLFFDGQENIDANLSLYFSSLVNYAGLSNDGTSTNSVINDQMFNRYFQCLMVDLEEISADLKGNMQAENFVNIIVNPYYKNILGNIVGAANNDTITFQISCISMNTFITVYSDK